MAENICVIKQDVYKGIINVTYFSQENERLPIEKSFLSFSLEFCCQQN